MAKPTSVTVDPAAAQALRLFAVQAGGVIGRRVTRSDALVLACQIATAHLTEVEPAAAALGLTTSED